MKQCNIAYFLVMRVCKILGFSLLISAIINGIFINCYSEEMLIHFINNGTVADWYTWKMKVMGDIGLGYLMSSLIFLTPYGFIRIGLGMGMGW